MTVNAHPNSTLPYHHIGLFLIMTLALGICFASLPVLTDFYMFTPALATLLTLLLTGELRPRTLLNDLGLSRFDWRNWPAAILLPTVALTPGYLVLMGLGQVQYDPRLAQYTVLGSVIYVIATLFLNTLTFSLGEEIGWRGYLLPRLLPLGETSAFTLTGLIWALWHFPLIFLGKRYFEAGQLVPKTLLFTLTLVAISGVVGRLWIQHRSLWVVALFHSAHNTVWGLWSNLVLPTPTVTLWAGESGIIPMVLYTLLALGMWQKARKTTAPQKYGH